MLLESLTFCYRVTAMSLCKHVTKLELYQNTQAKSLNRTERIMRF